MRDLKIKSKLLLAFMTVSVFSLLFVLVSIWIYKERERISEELNTLEDIQILSLQQYKLQQEFFLHETINIEFYRTGNSLILNNHKQLADKINSNLQSLINSVEAGILFSPNFLNNLIKEQNNYENLFKEVVKEIKFKGFKDFGIEGEMRNYAHALMEVKNLNQTKILMLRRNEKDFIIRKEVIYISQFNSLITNLKEEIKSNGNLSIYEKIRLDSIINGYSSAFKKLVNSNTHLVGQNNRSGLVFQLSNKHNLIINSILINKLRASKIISNVFQKLMITAITTILIIFILAFLFSYRIAFEISKPIENLNIHISKYIESKFTITPLLEEKNSQDEIIILSNNFFKMSQEITGYIKFFEQKVDERTSEINKQNKEITRQKLKIHNQYKELFVKNISLEKQQNLILEKNKNITDSILYAERIQKAIMPSKTKLRNIVPNGFIFFQPRDIVSGDFYFAIEKGEKVFFGVADCTGHGVPGAFLSIIGNHAIRRAINEFNLEKPSEILNKVNDLVEDNISNHDETIIYDGMDIAICAFDKKNNIIEYAGANMRLWLVREEEEDNSFLSINTIDVVETNLKCKLVEYTPDKQPIGHFHFRKPFTNNKISVNKNDRLYISSDGFSDQFGGPKNKKYKNNRFRELILNIQEKTMDEQKIEIKSELKNWKGDNEQIDDICILGIQI
jgi:serine phosphatase RsbU (regulator of sigma subunit)